MKKFLPIVLFLMLAACSPTETIFLEELDLTSMSSGWGSPKANRSVTDNPLLINGQEFESGVGTHATSAFLIDLGGTCRTFSALVGVDDASDTLASVRFHVLGDGKLLWESEIMRKGMDAFPCQISIRNVQQLGLLVTDAGDGIGYDHANWAEAVITYSGDEPKAAQKTAEEPYLLTPPAPETPRINGPAIVGARPGSPIIYRIPATGKAPLSFSVKNLPAGMQLKSGSRIITGKIQKRGDYKIQISVKNDLGTDQKELIIRVGDTLALTPHMGWNSWYIHYNRVSEAIMRQAADQMIATGMADYGYQYVNIDDCWMVKVDSDDPEIGGPVRDSNGKLLTNKRFPDIKGMTNYIHSLGLLAGTYISPGPSTCAGYAGSYTYEALDARTFSDWGFDFLKYDWCSYGQVEPPESREDYMAPYDLMWNELKKQKRDIVLNLCQYGMNQVWEWGGNVGNSWRTTGDLGLESGGSMPGFYYIGRSNAEHWQYAKPGNWNDPDYILIGWVGSAHGMGEGVQTNLTPSEQYFYMTLWSLMAAPLIFSGDMAKLDPFTLNVLCNHEVIAVNQDILGKQGRIIRESNGELIMTKDLADGSRALGLFRVSGTNDSPADHFNWGEETSRKVKVSAEELGFTGKMIVRDLWRQKDLGEFEGLIEVEVAPHGAGLLQVKGNK